MRGSTKPLLRRPTITLANPRQPCPETDLGPVRRTGGCGLYAPGCSHYPPAPGVSAASSTREVWKGHKTLPLPKGPMWLRATCGKLSGMWAGRAGRSSSLSKPPSSQLARDSVQRWGAKTAIGGLIHSPHSLLCLKLSTCPAEAVWHWLKASCGDQWSRLNPVTKPYTYGQPIFTRGAKTIQWGKDNLISKLCQDNWTATWKGIAIHRWTQNGMAKT